MAITSIDRDYGVSPSIVRLSTTDNYAAITASDYLTSQFVNIFNINGGVFGFLASDLICCYYNGGHAFFSLSSDFSTLVELGSSSLTILGTPLQVTAVTSGTNVTIGLTSGINISSIVDSSNIKIANFSTITSAMNYFNFSNNISGSSPIMRTAGSDTDIDFEFITKGIGEFDFFSQSTDTVINVISGANFQHATSLNFPSSADSNTITFPDSTGTLAITSDLPNQSVNTGSTPSFVSIKTSPAVSSSSSIALGSAFQNTLGYDAVFTAYISFTSPAGTYTLASGIGSTNTPTQQNIFVFTSAAVVPVTLYIPNNYYALLSVTGTVTSAIVGQQAMPV